MDEPNPTTGEKSDANKSRSELIAELEDLRKQYAELRQSVLHDTAEHELALQESERRFRRVVENVDEGIAIVDSEDQFIFANPSAERIFGVGAGELVGTSLSGYINKETAAFFGRQTELRRRGETGRYDASIVSRDGLKKEISVTASPYLTDDGEYIGALGTFRDITSRKLAEESLRESEMRLGMVADATTDLVYEWDILNDSLEWYGDLEAVLGYEPLGIERSIEGWLSLIHPEDAERLKDAVERHRTETTPISEVYRVLRGDGTWAWWLDRGIPILENEKPVRWIGACTDITERKHAEKALQESEKRFRDLAEMLPAVVFEADLDMNLRYANEKAFELFGYSRADLEKGLNGLQMIAPDQLEDAKANIMRRMEGELLGATEYVGQRADGTKFPVLLHMNPIFGAAGPEGFRGIVVDISDRKAAQEEKEQLEEQLRRAQKLETVGTLAGGIAHDFNNVLAPILGYTDMALQSLDSSDPMAKDLQQVLDAANRAKELVQQILLFSKQAEQERKPINLRSVVDEVLKLLRPTIPASIDIRLRSDTSDRMVLADATQMHQVIVNLCTNASHAMREGGGTLSLELSRETVDNEGASSAPKLANGEYVRLSVIDSGPGMDGDTLERLFEPFFTTKAVDEGTGLGLSVVHGIVQSHGGDILVESELGSGSTFHIYVPTIAAASDVDQPESNDPQCGNETLLVVDDEPAIADLVKTMLVGCGYRVDAFFESADALEAVRSQPDKYDLVVSDLTMPHMTGTVLAKELHRHRADLPVIIMTGYGDSLSTDITEDAGVLKVLRKPLRMNDLAQVVRAALDG